MSYDLRALTARFHILGDFVEGGPYGSGHINDTFAVTVNQGGTAVRYILQRINDNVFKDVAGLMANIGRVTRHQHATLGHGPEPSRRALTLVPAREGGDYVVDDAGSAWRAYLFIEHATTYDDITDTSQAFEAARAFGAFMTQLRDLPGGPLIESIPDFHNTPARFRVLQEAIAADVCNRAAGVAAEIRFALAREAMTGVLVDLQERGDLPTVTTHNDTKLNNVMLDDATGEGVCVIDLDTVMPGLSLYDFGDMIRTAARPVPEDATDLESVVARLDMVEAITRGYMAAAGDALVPAEIEQLAFSGRLMTFEVGIRFLADYLQGDVYFKTHRAGHNLDRCRVQFKMVESMEQQQDAMERIAREAAAG